MDGDLELKAAQMELVAWPLAFYGNIYCCKIGRLLKKPPHPNLDANMHFYGSFTVIRKDRYLGGGGISFQTPTRSASATSGEPACRGRINPPLSHP
jgi:hypothetical protein